MKNEDEKPLGDIIEKPDEEANKDWYPKPPTNQKISVEYGTFKYTGDFWFLENVIRIVTGLSLPAVQAPENEVIDEGMDVV